MDFRDLIPRREDIFAIAVVAIAYFITGRLGIELYAVNGFATFVWAPTGIAIAAMLLAGKRVWLGVLLGAFAVNLTAGAPFFVSLLLGVGNSLEAFAAIFFLERYVRFDAAFARLRDAIGFIIGAGLIAPLVAATIGTLTLFASGTIFDRVFDTWTAWYVGDALGALVVAPLLLVWLGARKEHRERPELTELAGLTASLVVANVASFYGAPVIFGTIPLIYLVIFPLIWAALRFGVRGITLSIFITATIAISATVQGSGPFAAPTVSDSLLGVQFFIGCVTMVFLLLASVSLERKRALEDLNTYVDNLETSLQEMRLGAERQRVRREKK